MNRILSGRDVRVGIKEVLVVERNVHDKVQPICDDAELESIAEVPINVHLRYGKVRGNM